MEDDDDLPQVQVVWSNTSPPMFPSRRRAADSLFAKDTIIRNGPCTPPCEQDISQTLQDRYAGRCGTRSKLRTPRTLTRIMQQHRDNERTRHRGLNASIMEMSKRIPGYSDSVRETKILKLQRVISYICHLEKHIQELCEQQHVDLEYKNLFLSPHIKRDFFQNQFVPRVPRPRNRTTSIGARPLKTSAPKTLSDPAEDPGYGAQAFDHTQILGSCSTVSVPPGVTLSLDDLECDPYSDFVNTDGVVPSTSQGGRLSMKRMTEVALDEGCSETSKPKKSAKQGRRSKIAHDAWATDKSSADEEMEEPWTDGDEQYMLTLLGDSIVDQVLADKDIDVSLDWLDMLGESPCSSPTLPGAPPSQDCSSTDNDESWNGQYLDPSEITSTINENPLPSPLKNITPWILDAEGGAYSENLDQYLSDTAPPNSLQSSPTIHGITESFGRLKSPSCNPGGIAKIVGIQKLPPVNSPELVVPNVEDIEGASEKDLPTDFAVPNPLLTIDTGTLRELTKELDSDSCSADFSNSKNDSEVSVKNNESLSSRNFPTTHNSIKEEDKKSIHIKPGINAKVVKINDGKSSTKKVITIIVNKKVARTLGLQKAAMQANPLEQLNTLLQATSRARNTSAQSSFAPKTSPNAGISIDQDRSDCMSSKPVTEERTVKESSATKAWPSVCNAVSSHLPDSPFSTASGLLRGDENPLLSKSQGLEFPKFNPVCQRKDMEEKPPRGLVSPTKSLLSPCQGSNAKLASLLGIEEDPVLSLGASLQTSPENSLTMPFDLAPRSGDNWETPALHFKLGDIYRERINEDPPDPGKIGSPLFSQESGFHSCAGEMSERSDLYTPSDKRKPWNLH